MHVGPACEAFWKADAVFDGTVLGIEPIETQLFIGGTRRQATEKLVTLALHRSWKGVDQTPEIQVITAPDGAACGFDFKVGERYLVFARPSGIDHRLRVSLCSATHRYEPSGDSLEFLDSLTRSAPGGRVFGNISYSAIFLDHDREGPQTAVDVDVILRGPGGERRTRSRAARYEFTGLSTGSYEVEFQAPERYESRGRTEPFEIPNERACAQRDSYVAPAGRISGRVLDHTGAPFRKSFVEITRADARLHPDYGLSIRQAYTGDDGFFELRGLPPGSYVVGVNLRDLPSQYRPHPRVVYPGLGQPVHVITIALGQAADLGTWQLPPPLPVVKIDGTIVWTDGSPAAGVYVALTDVTGNPAERARGAGGSTADANGRFVIDGRLGRIYRFFGRSGNGPDLLVSSPEIHTEGPVTVKLVARRAPPR